MTGGAAEFDLERRWACDLSALTYERIPKETLESIKLLILDSLGTALAASTLGDGREQLKAFIQSQPPSDDCTLFGYGGRGSTLTAGFVNGALVHALNYDALGVDGGHVGLASVPTPLAVAEKEKSSGKDLLVAVCAGAEFTCRLAGALHRAGLKHQDRFLEGQVLGYFGATAAAGRLLSFDPLSMHDALGFALMQASGTRQVSIEGGGAKALYGGFPNLGAIVSTTMARHGGEARCSFLEGEAGLYNLFFGGRFDRSVLANGLRDEFWSSRLAFKPWPISSVVQPFVEAALSLRERERIDPAAIQRIRLKVHPRGRSWIEPFAERCRPNTAATASNSIPFCLSKVLATGRLTLEDFRAGAGGLADPSATRIAEQIDYSFVDHSAADGRETIVIELLGGKTVRADVGDECKSPGTNDMIAKFRDCAKYALVPLTSATVDIVIERIMKLETVADVSTVTGLLRAPD